MQPLIVQCGNIKYNLRTCAEGLSAFEAQNVCGCHSYRSDRRLAIGLESPSKESTETAHMELCA